MTPELYAKLIGYAGALATEPGDPEPAELVHTAWLNRAERHDAEGNLASYWWQAMAWALKDWRRRERRRESILRDNAPRTRGQSTEHGALTHLALAEVFDLAARDVNVALVALTAAGYAQRDLAPGLSRQAIKSRVHRGRETLREELGAA